MYQLKVLYIRISPAYQIAHSQASYVQGEYSQYPQRPSYVRMEFQPRSQTLLETVYELKTTFAFALQRLMFILLIYGSLGALSLVASSIAVQVLEGFTTEESKTLSWPSACWALVAIALNTMTQPSVAILGFRPQYSFVLRSSPLICVLDTVDTMFNAAHGGIEQRSVFKGFGLAYYQGRFADIQPGYGGSFGALCENTVFHALLVLLGAIPQVIKLYAARGIP